MSFSHGGCAASLGAGSRETEPLAPASSGQCGLRMLHSGHSGNRPQRSDQVYVQPLHPISPHPIIRHHRCAKAWPPCLHLGDI